MLVARHITKRNTFFLFVTIALFLIFYTTIKELIALSFHNELYSHITLIPFVSGYFIFLERKKIFSDSSYSITSGFVLIIIGTICFILGYTQGNKLNQEDYVSLMTLSVLTIWIGSFVLFYGIRALKNASFPIMFLIFMVPIPTLIVNKVIIILQSASAEVSYVIFKIAGVPIYREGFVFHLPGATVEVAKECSGIRSTFALFITSILAGHLFLKTGWKKFVLALSIFPIAVIKNGLRIITLSLLGAYVDMSYLTDSPLHRNGGIPFFILALILLIPILWLLRRSERGESDDKAVVPHNMKEKKIL